MWSNCHDTELLNEILELSWKGVATKKMIKEFEEQKLNDVQT